MEEREIAVYERLRSMSIEYERYEHPAPNTMEDCFEIDKKIGIMHCKNLFLCNRTKTQFYLLLIMGDKRFHTATVSKLLGISRLSFSSAEQMRDKLNVLPGAVSPMGLIFNREHDIHVVIDDGILNEERVLVHPCVATASIALTPDSILRFIDDCGNSSTIITLPYE